MEEFKYYLKNRNKKLQIILEEKNINVFMVTDSQNLLYLSGYENEDAYILKILDKSYYFTDMRYFAEAKEQIKHMEVICLSEKFKFSNFCTEKKIEKIFFEEHHITVGRLKKLKSTGINFEGIESPILELRYIKDEYEIEQIKIACDISNEAFEVIKNNLEKYKTELEIAWEYERLVRERGASGVSFDPIIANGVGSSIPHYKTSSKKIDTSKLTLMDLGCKYNGYASDMTRVILPNHVDRKIENIFNLVQEAKDLATGMVKLGVSGKDLDFTVRNFFKERNLEDNFTHSLGHSVGLDVHDGFSVSHLQDIVLEKNMVITIEPGLYFENEFGIRLEDTIIVQ